MTMPLEPRQYAFVFNAGEARRLARAVSARQGASASNAPFFLGLVLGIPVVGLSVLSAIGFGLMARVEARSVIIAAVLAYFLGFFGAQTQRWLERRRARIACWREAASEEPRTVEISGQGIAVKKNGVNSAYEWRALDEAELAGPLLIIWTKAAEAIAVPLRLVSETEAAGVIEQVRERAGER